MMEFGRFPTGKYCEKTVNVTLARTGGVTAETDALSRKFSRLPTQMEDEEEGIAAESPSDGESESEREVREFWGRRNPRVINNHT